MSRAGATAIWQSLRNGDYPIITLEWRRMMRKKLQMWAMALGAAALMMLGFGAILFRVLHLNSRPGANDTLYAIGIIALVSLGLLKLGVLFLVAPGYAARLIPGQQESGTFQLLAVTSMSSRLVVGQVAAICFGQVLAVTVISMPATIAWATWREAREIPWPLFGGGLVGELLQLLTAAAYVCAGLLCSCISRSVGSAVSTTYALIIVGISAVLWTVHRLAMLVSFGGAGDEMSRLPVGVSIALTGLTMAALTALFLWLAVHALNSARRGRLGGLA